MTLSVIVPFYKGNEYLHNLFASIESVREYIQDIEVIVVNDSPEVTIELPASSLSTTVVVNEHNMGIQGARINGILHSSGDWILMLDQDDELIPEGFEHQIELTQNADVVVGNGIYCMGKVRKIVYDSLAAMTYLIDEKNFIKIRNLIPSPGECLIRRTVLPEIWMQNQLENNGADDWFLWLLLFRTGTRFAVNYQTVYVHNDTGGRNLSADLDKMRKSSLEMIERLRVSNIYEDEELARLTHSVDFKFYQDTHNLNLERLCKYKDALWDNIKYRAVLIGLKLKKAK